MTYLSLGLRTLLTLAFVAAGGAKLAGVGMMVDTFEAIGFGQGFRYLTGLIEITGAALLWLPNRQALGAAVLGGTMVGAVLTHWFILGPSAVHWSHSCPGDDSKAAALHRLGVTPGRVAASWWS